MELISKYFPKLSPRQYLQFDQLSDLYTYWNQQINVVSRKDISELYTRHILHSLSIAKVINFAEGTKVLDVGTGGGFPGIPLAILFPKVQFTLVDSIQKKMTVTSDVTAQLGLDNVKCICTRAEQIEDSFDFVVSRAVTRMDKFVCWVSDRISNSSKNDLDNGILYLKGGELEEELASFKQVWIYDLPDFFEESFFETKKVVYLPHKSFKNRK